MADEISLAFTMRVVNGNFVLNEQESVTVDQTTLGGGNPGTIDVGTAAEVIDFGDVTTRGYTWMKNLDATNFVKWGPDSGGSLIEAGRMEPGEVSVFRIAPTGTMRIQADTAPCKVLVRTIWD